MHDEADASPDRASLWRPWMARGLFEAGLIVFSVLLALALSQWAAGRDDQRRMLETRRFFAEEVRANRDLLRSPPYLPHHETLGRNLQRAAAHPDEPAAQFAKDAYGLFDSGMHPTPFRQAVWSSVSGSDVLGRMPPREVFALSEIYRLQDDLAGTHRAMYATLTEMDPETQSPAVHRRQVRVLQLYTGDVVGYESTLATRYDQVLKLLDKPNP